MSTIPSGLGAALGIAEEVTWGTAVTPPTRWYEFRGMALAQDIARIESEAIRANTRVMRSDDWTPGRKGVAGDLTVELSTKNMALLHKHMFGGVATSGAGPYTHTFTPGTLTGKGLTVQELLPDTSGTVRALTVPGVKVASWELSFDNEGLVPLTLSFVGKSATTATAAGTPSYTSSNNVFSFAHGSLTIAGSSAPVRSGSLSGDNGLDLERFFFGQDTISEPLEAGMREYGGSLEIDFESLTQYDRFVNGTEAALVIAFTRGSDSITYTANVRFDGATPEVGGPEILSMTVPYKCVGSTTDASALTAVVVSSESTP
jgi:hypothetical protein